MIRTPSAQELLYARSHIATHAHAFGLDAIGACNVALLSSILAPSLNSRIDLVCVDFKDPAKLTQESLQGAQMGFTGKQAIHPAQIQPIYEAFKPPQVDLSDSILALRILLVHETLQSHYTKFAPLTLAAARPRLGKEDTGGESEASGRRKGCLLDRR